MICIRQGKRRQQAFHVASLKRCEFLKSLSCPSHLAVQFPFEPIQMDIIH